MLQTLLWVVRRDHWRSTPAILEGMCRLLAQPGGDAVPKIQDVSLLSCGLITP